MTPSNYDSYSCENQNDPDEYFLDNEEENSCSFRDFKKKCDDLNFDDFNLDDLNSNNLYRNENSNQNFQTIQPSEQQESPSEISLHFNQNTEHEDDFFADLNFDDLNSNNLYRNENSNQNFQTTQPSEQQESPSEISLHFNQNTEHEDDFFDDSNDNINSIQSSEQESSQIINNYCHNDYNSQISFKKQKNYIKITKKSTQDKFEKKFKKNNKNNNILDDDMYVRFREFTLLFGQIEYLDYASNELENLLNSLKLGFKFPRKEVNNLNNSVCNTLASYENQFENNKIIFLYLMKIVDLFENCNSEIIQKYQLKLPENVREVYGKFAYIYPISYAYLFELNCCYKKDLNCIKKFLTNPDKKYFYEIINDLIMIKKINPEKKKQPNKDSKLKINHLGFNLFRSIYQNIMLAKKEGTDWKNLCQCPHCGFKHSDHDRIGGSENALKKHVSESCTGKIYSEKDNSQDSVWFDQLQSDECIPIIQSNQLCSRSQISFTIYIGNMNL